MYSIVLTNGKIINIDAAGVDWCEKTRMASLFVGKDYLKKEIAKINMDNVVGWIDTSYVAEGEGEE